jgi:hypothetical protein
MEGNPLDAADQRFAIGPEAVVSVAANGIDSPESD